MNRNFGLDIVRSLAIIMVLISHSKIFLLPYAKDKSLIMSLSIFGLYGVELFFVLSGFLIGQILLRDVVPNPSFTQIFTFYIRRWFRTLPAYYLVLVLLIFTSNINSTTPNFHPFHFVFLQNFIIQEMNFFGVSWSLSVEEWFYLLSPVMFYFCFTRNHNPTYISRVLIISILIINVLRAIFVNYIDPTWDADVRKFVPLRFDSLLLGILLAHIKQTAPTHYKFLNNKYILALSFIGLTGLALFFIPKFPTPSILDQSFFARTISFTFISFFMVMCLPFFEQSTFINQTIRKNRFAYPLFTKISLWSYVIYLIHLDLFIYFSKLSTSLKSSISFWAISLFLTFSISATLHKYYEKPIMDLRDKIQLVVFNKEQNRNIA